MEERTPVVLSNKLYDKIKALVTVWLPLISALYFGLGNIWGWPKIEEIVGSLAILMTVLGGLVAKTSADYKRNNEAEAGFLKQVGHDEYGMPHMQVIFNKNPEELVENKTVTFKVKPEPPTQ
jgi:hypothetical protein